MSRSNILTFADDKLFFSKVLLVVPYDLHKTANIKYKSLSVSLRLFIIILGIHLIIQVPYIYGNDFIPLLLFNYCDMSFAVLVQVILIVLVLFKADECSLCLHEAVEIDTCTRFMKLQKENLLKSKRNTALEITVTLFIIGAMLGSMFMMHKSNIALSLDVIIGYPLFCFLSSQTQVCIFSIKYVYFRIFQSLIANLLRIIDGDSDLEMLKTCLLLFRHIESLSKRVNKNFSLLFFILISCTFISAVGYSYFLIIVYYKHIFEDLSDAELRFYIYTITWIAIRSYIIWSCAANCQSLILKSEEIYARLWKRMMTDKLGALQRNKILLSHIYLRKTIKFTACNFFQMDYFILLSMVTSTITYNIIFLKYPEIENIFRFN